MSRTKRIYNSYRRYGRFFPKDPAVFGLIPPFDLNEDENLQANSDIRGIRLMYARRWHPYAQWCMGNCPACRRWNKRESWTQAKHTRKQEEMKFNFFL